MTWVLVLTLVFNGYKAGGASVSQQPGFQSEAACLKAGNAWLAQTRPAPNVYARALCVPSK